ncbi:MAG: ATPase [Fusobacteriaceae bacterium]
MIKNLVCSENVKSNIFNELSNRKVAGTYIFYGNDRGQLKELATSFGKALNCKNNQQDFCDECESCKRMDARTHGDLEILSESGGIKIESVRELTQKMAVSSYEGGAKIFILEDINRMKPVASNALLKTIEEPLEGNFFFLLTTSLNILPTIKSRATIIKVPELSCEDLGVTEPVYEFFARNTTDIMEYKKGKYNLDESVDFLRIGEFMKQYFKDKNSDVKSLGSKINIYKSLREFVKNLKWTTPIDKVFFVEELVSNLEERDFIFDILKYIAFLNSSQIDMKLILTEKNKMRLPVNIKASLMKIFC